MRIFRLVSNRNRRIGGYNSLNRGLCLIYDRGADHTFWRLEKLTAMMRVMAQIKGGWLWC